MKDRWAIETGKGKFDWRISEFFDTEEEAKKALAELLALPWIKFMDDCVINYTGKYLGIYDEWKEET